MDKCLEFEIDKKKESKEAFYKGIKFEIGAVPTLDGIKEYFRTNNRRPI